jgi:tetratricopeptide (TPR) repeat protein
MSNARLIEAQRLIAEGQPAAAIDLLRPHLDGARSFEPAHALSLEALVRMGDRRTADALLLRALDLKPEQPDALDALAFYARLLDRHELSNDLYRRAAEAAGDDGQLWYNLATSERSLGRLTEAAEACERALSLEPDRFPAVLLRSELTRATATSNRVAALQIQLAAERSDAGRMFIAYALGKELHDLGRYAEAFAAFTVGARVRRETLRYDVGEDEHKLARIRTAFPKDLRAGGSGGRARHIFIIGLPRSGTTLTERILGALPGVRSNGETNNFSTALLRAAPAGPGDIFDRCAAASPSAVGQAYEAIAAFDGFEGAIIEKLPMNYIYLGPIAEALPDARLIWLRRHPLDSCFAMFRTLFGEAYPFSYDFEDLARYYAAYERLMAHWQATLGERLYEIDYEDLVARPHRVGQALAGHCGLPWTDQATDITRNRNASLTASAAQVREPIHERSAGLWRHYAEELKPLADRLRALGVSVD